MRPSAAETERSESLLVKLPLAADRDRAGVPGGAATRAAAALGAERAEVEERAKELADAEARLASERKQRPPPAKRSRTDDDFFGSDFGE